MTLENILSTAPVAPVLVVEERAHAVPLARALVAGGLPVLEITLRTPAALDAIEAIADELPDATVGVGTVTRPAQLDDAVAAGARFAVSPGLTPNLLSASRNSPIVALLPEGTGPSRRPINC